MKVILPTAAKDLHILPHALSSLKSHLYINWGGAAAKNRF